MAAKKNDNPGNVIKFKDKDGAIHWASRTAPDVVKGLDAGTITILEEVAPDAPKVPAPSDAPNAASPKSGS